MPHSIADFFHSEHFMPHGHCFLWQPDILWLHVFSDAATATAYFCIPLVLIGFISKRKDLPFQAVFLLFGAFIWLCGLTHALDIWVIWRPDYAAQGILKAMTAIVSLATLFMLIRLVPQALLLPSPTQLSRLNDELRDSNRRLETLYTQMKESNQAHLRAVVDNALNGLISIDARGNVESFNPACERIFGYKAEEVIGRNIKMLMPEPYHGEHDGYLSHYNATGHARIIGSAGREVRGKRKDGSLFPLDLSVSAFALEDGKHFSGILRDITERKKAEKEKEELIQRLTESNIELERFAYICSHDLQEPLRMISNFSERLGIYLEDKFDDKARHYMKYVIDGAEHARQMISDVLNYARLNSETELLAEIDGNKALDEVLQDLSVRIQETGACVTRGALPVLYIQPTHLRQLLQNLISNALKFCAGKPEVHVEAVRQGEFWHFSVRDNGIGIAPEHQVKLFTIFQRLNSRHHYPGSGIGLAICKKVAQKYGGKIGVESEEGKGSTFFFTLPCGANAPTENTPG